MWCGWCGVGVRRGVLGGRHGRRAARGTTARTRRVSARARAFRPRAFGTLGARFPHALSARAFGDALSAHALSAALSAHALSAHALSAHALPAHALPASDAVNGKYERKP